MLKKCHATATILAVAMTVPGTANAVPISIDGFAINKFVDIQVPILISIDASGNVYAGHDPPGGGTGEPARIRLVSPDGSSVTSIGDLIPDPDAVIVDAQGHLATAGNIIVGSGASAHTLREVNPVTGATSGLLSGSPIVNPHEMVFDSQGRLYVGQIGFPVLVVDQGSASNFASFSGHNPLATAIDESDQLYVGLGDNSEVYRLDVDGILPTQLVATVPGSLTTVEYSAIGPLSGSLFVGTGEGDIYELNPQTGGVELFATGFGVVRDIQFNSGGVMYVSDETGDVIWTVAVPEPSTYALAVIGLLAIGAYRASRYRRTHGRNHR